MLSSIADIRKHYFSYSTIPLCDEGKLECLRDKFGGFFPTFIGQLTAKRQTGNWGKERERGYDV